MSVEAMKRSPEIEAVVRRFLTSGSDGHPETFRSLLSQSTDVREIGTDEDEWLQGWEECVRLHEAHAQEIGRIDVEITRLEAFERGSVGWAAAESEVTYHDPNRAVPDDITRYRCTLVLLLEAGIWRIIQVHFSIGVPNEEVFGFELTATLADLVSVLNAEDVAVTGEMIPTTTATVMFTDIEDSTQLSQALGDEVWAAKMRSHFDKLRRVVEAEGGGVVKTLGDGAMFVFPSAGSALRAAVAIQEVVSAADDGFSVRIGVHAGDVRRVDDDYFGTTVNTAARITAAASGGEIMASSVAAELAGDHDCVYGEPLTVQLKGFARTTRIVPVLRRPA